MVLCINMARIFYRLRKEGGDIPKWPRVKRLQSVESGWNVGSCASGDESSCAKTHPESSDTQCKTFVVRQVGDYIGKRELQIDRVLLNRRRWIRFARNDPGDALDKEAYPLP